MWGKQANFGGEGRPNFGSFLYDCLPRLHLNGGGAGEGWWIGIRGEGGGSHVRPSIEANF